LEGGNRNFGKPLEWRDRMKLDGSISTSYRYEIDTIGTDLLSLKDLEVVDLEKSQKLRYF